MRRALELFISRILRSRVGLALLLAVVIVGVIGAAKLLGGNDTQAGSLAPLPAVSRSVDPDAGEDGIDSPAPAPSPYVSPGTAQPLAVARAFALAWLDHAGVSAEQWHDGLLPHMTPRLTDLLRGVDPAEVPAERVTAEPTLIPRAEEFVEVVVPVDSGELRLQLVATDGHWLVDAVDWARS